MRNKIESLEKVGLLLATLSLVVLSACTKNIPYEELPPDQKEHTESKSFFDEKSEYLYSASMQDASRSSTDAMPFASGDNKRVKLEIGENTLRVLETERDARYAPNGTNNKLVLEIPIEHTEFRCATDRFGECTNKEENATKIPWNLRTGIKIKLEDAKSGDLDLLPILESQTTGDNCYETVSTRLFSSKVETDAINFQIERTFKTKLNCLNELDKISDATITAVYHYSLIKLSSILSKDFQTVSYPESSADERTFGFFSSRSTKLDVDNRNTEKSLMQIMNHWNPNRTQIDYHLSEAFAKPENKKIKDLTYKAVGSINAGLAEAGARFRISLHEPSGKAPGDIRNSMIVLVEDPVNSGILGYGPQTEDPVTGEIISARTIMFLGNIKRGMVKSSYEQVVREKRARKANAAKLAKGSDANFVASTTLLQRMGLMMVNNKSSAALAALADLAIVKPILVKASANKKKFGSAIPVVPAAKISQIRNYVKNYTARVNPEVVGTDLKSHLLYIQQAKNCAFKAPESGFGTVSESLLARFPADAKPWEQLSADEKTQVIDILLPDVYATTLIHELGHNLGLRHNFQASEDKENFLTADELKANNIDHEVPFSSVMDYGDDLRALPILGKYDVAALRFGYARQVEVEDADGKVALQKISTTLTDLKKSQPALNLKTYGFCTDEHVGINAGCKRWDLGTSYTQIIQNYINEYEETYYLRNMRSGRSNYSLIGDLGYASHINSTFKEMRVMLEVRERIKYRFGLADDAEEYKSVEFLKDLNDATTLAANFLAKVLVTPDISCAVVKIAKPNEIYDVINLKQIDKEALSCFAVQLNPAFKVIAQTGKAFNSIKDPESANAYADQIDVRGIWLDKMIAAKHLFKRQTGIFSFDSQVDSFVNVAHLRTPLNSVVRSIMENNMISNATFTTFEGETFELEIPYDMFETQVIDKPIVPALGRILGIHENSTTPLQTVLGTIFANGMSDPTGAHEEDRDLGLAISVKRYDSNQVIDPRLPFYLNGMTKYVAEDSNELAKETITGINTLRNLEKLDRDKLIEIAQARLAQGKMPDSASLAEKAAWEIPIETLISFLQGRTSSAFYVRLLQVLPNSVN